MSAIIGPLLETYCNKFIEFYIFNYIKPHTKLRHKAMVAESLIQ